MAKMNNFRSRAANLDSFDIKILEILQRDASLPQRIVAESVGLSAPAVQRRIKRLRDTGVIERIAAVLSPDAVGGQITIVVAVEVESERADLIDAAKASFRQSPEIQQCYYVTGEFDFILVAIVESMQSFEAFTKRVFFENPNIKRFRTLVAMDRVEVGLRVPLP